MFRQKPTTHQKVIKILQKSTQNVNSNAGVFLAKQLLDRMGGFSRFDSWQKAARSVPYQRYSNSSLVKAQVALMALGKTTFSDVEDFGLVKTAGGERIPLDIDVSVLVNDDSRKEGVGFTYHRIDGFAPIFATLGRIGYQLANEMRPGSRHSQKGFPCHDKQRI